MKLNRFLGATALVGALIAIPTSAFAQTTDPNVAHPSNADQGCTDSAGNPKPCDTVGGNIVGTEQRAYQEPTAAAPGTNNSEVVVTGTRIIAPNVISTSPITSIGPTQLEATARVSIGDTLNNLPQLQSTFSQSNSTRFLGTAGLNLLDLYGLGPQRTLVLVNGRRHVGGDILNNAVSVDINTLPTDLIERVDIVTGGQSGVYGSDAIAGVVNFVLKDHYDGLQLKGEGAISQYGDAGTYSASILAGKNFGGGRGNIAIDLEYARQNQFFASQRRSYSRNDGFVAVDSDPAGLSPGQTNINYDGNPDSVFFRDIRSATIYDGGLVSFANQTGACGRDNSPTAAFGGAGRPFTCNFLFQSDGTVVAENGGRVGLGATLSTVTARNQMTGAATTTVTSPSATPTGVYIGGNGNTRRETQLLQLLPRQDRYAANLIGHYDFSDAFVPFVEASYVRTDTFGAGQSGPAFFTGSTLDAFYERPRLDNPYLSTGERNTIAAAALAQANSGFNPTTGAAFANTYTTNADGTLTLTRTAAQAQAASIASINAGSYRFILRKNFTDLGFRSEASRRETYRIVGGVRGTFNDDWRYEVSANYGEFDENTKVLGNVNVQRLLLALDAVRAPNGQIVCGSSLDPTRAGASTGGDLAGNPAMLAADVAACQPVNPFGVNSASQAAKNYILQNTVSKGKITQLDISGSIQGDSSQLFSFPGGPAHFSIGGEYRRETNFFREDPLVSAGYTFYNAIDEFDPTSFEVKEGFGELLLPILKDLPFANSLELNGSGRVSDYKGSAGTVYTYSGGAAYAPIHDITFRGNYSRSVRAPNLSELYSPTSQNFAPGFMDPCSARNLAGGTQYRAANCAAAGIPTSYDYVYAQSLEIQSGGNPNLNVEKSDSYTGGILLQPRFAPGLSLSSDYYKITVNNVITAVAAQSIVNNCYDSPTLNNPFCGSFTRVGAGMTGPAGEEAYRIVEGSLLQSVLNFAKLKVSGVNTTLAYTHKLGIVTLDAQLQWTHQFTNQTFTNPADPTFGDNVLGELSQPRDATNLTVSADFGTFFTNLQFRYLSKMSVGAIENHQAFEGRPPQNLDDYDIPFYPDVFYADARIGVNIQDHGSFYFGIDNLTNRLPPLGLTGLGFGSAIYDNVGRRFYAGITAKF